MQSSSNNDSPDQDARRKRLDDRIRIISRCAKEAVRREVEYLRARNLPIYVMEDGRVIDLNEEVSGDR